MKIGIKVVEMEKDGFKRYWGKGRGDLPNDWTWTMGEKTRMTYYPCPQSLAGATHQGGKNKGWQCKAAGPAEHRFKSQLF